MKRYRSQLCLIVFFSMLAGSCDQKEEIIWISSVDNERWAFNEVSDAIEDKEMLQTIEIFPGQKEQMIDGFGGCFNELGWDALNMVDEKMQDSIFRQLFMPGEGLNFNICRMPVGANDYARDWYSLNDSAGDFEMKYFNIERDQTTLIPYIQKAMEYNPEIKIWGSPWCPPAWMKTNNHYACRPAPVNDLSPDMAGAEGITQFIMEDKYLSAYALYFKKYIESYRNEGINVYAIHVQNEPNSCQNFPSCIWTAKDLNTFIGKYLGPALKENTPDAEIWYGTIERPFPEKIDTVLQDELSSQYVTGLGFQWAGKGVIPYVNQAYPDVKLMQTESECGDGSNDWAAAEYTWGLLKHYLSNGANTYLYWNFILDETGKSQWGWKQNSLISVDSDTRKVSFNPEFYLMKHFSHFIQPGAYRISLESEYKDVLAFENPDGNLVVVIANNNIESQYIKIKNGNRELDFEIAPKSFNSIIL